MRLPGQVVSTVEGFVDSLDQAAPGLLAEAAVTGSALTDDWHPRASDIDVVFVVRRPVRPEDAPVLAALHSSTSGRPYVDGVYLTPDQIDAGPDAVATAPQVVDAGFTLEKPHGQLCWVTWRELADAPLLRVAPAGLSWHEPSGGFTEYDALAQFCRTNLTMYWGGVLDQWQAALDDGALEDSSVDADSVVWTVLGPGRLVTTIETGMVVSKEASGRYAARRWPAYTDLVERAVRHRRGDLESFDVADAQALVRLGREIVAAGQCAQPFGSQRPATYEEEP